jgi:beta-lactamase superfamily II metal-dependent hydrolase
VVFPGWTRLPSPGHSDHIGWKARRAQYFRPQELWIAFYPTSQALDKLIEQAQGLGITVVRHWTGDNFNLGSTTVHVLFPPRDWPVASEPKNNDSMVLLFNYGHPQCCWKVMRKEP